MKLLGKFIDNHDSEILTSGPIIEYAKILSSREILRDNGVQNGLLDYTVWKYYLRVGMTR